MLQKRRSIASIPDGLMATNAEMKKGSAVIRKLNATTGKYEIALPSTVDEAKDIYGFVTLRIDEDTHKDSYYDTIAKGVKAVVYTSVKNEEWATTEFVGSPAVGTKLVAEFSGEDAGKLKAVTTEDPMFEVIAVTPAMGGYEEAMISFKIL